MKINENYLKLRASYLVSEVAKRVKNYSAEHPDAKIIRLGIGDVTLPLSPCVISALHSAVDEMGAKDTFRGYCPEHGYDFVREAVKKHYSRFGVDVSTDSIFISDGAKSDVGNITDILGDNEILIPDPVYPVYRDSNIMCGRKISYINASADNMFSPGPENQPERSRVIYICSPNNPTGAVYDREGLKAWVDYANKTDSLIIFDSAYEAFIKDGKTHSLKINNNISTYCRNGYAPTGKVFYESAASGNGIVHIQFDWIGKNFYYSKLTDPSTLIYDMYNIRVFTIYLQGAGGGGGGGTNGFG